MLDKIGGRKVAATLLTLAIGCIITWFKGDVPAGMLQLLMVSLATFVAGNGVEHVASAIRGTDSTAPDAAPAASPSTDTDAVLAEIRKLQDASAVTQQGIGMIVQAIHGQPAAR
jgi:hypothetical protein